MKGVLVVLYCVVSFLDSSEMKPSEQPVKDRIVGGSNAEAGRFPFAAAIYVDTRTSRHFCTGAFIGFQWTLTSGNCLNNAILFTVRLGAARLDDPSAIMVATSNYFLHPDFDAETITADVGLIKYHEEIPFTDFFHSLYAWVLPMNVSQSAHIIGWGQTSDDVEGYSNQLQHVEVITLTFDVCKAYYGSQVTDNMMCVGGDYNEGICIGDNGGPLFVYVYGNPWTVGVASFISGNGCNGVEPSGYTRLHPYVSWVRVLVYGFD